MRGDMVNGIIQVSGLEACKVGFSGVCIWIDYSLLRLPFAFSVFTKATFSCEHRYHFYDTSVAGYEYKSVQLKINGEM